MYNRRSWVLAFIIGLIGFLLLFGLVVVEDQAWALMVIAGSFLLWYNYFSDLLQKREEEKRYAEWQKDLSRQKEEYLALHPIEVELKKETERREELKETLSAAEKQIIDEALQAQALDETRQDWDGK